MRYHEIIGEKAPPSAKAKRFIKKHKAEFQDRYGDAWKQVLYATAWKLFEAAAKGGTFEVYHGTPQTFRAFNDRQRGSTHGAAPINVAGFNFTDNPECARTFGENVLKCTVTIERPLVLNAKGAGYGVFKHKINTALDDFAKVRGKYDGVIIRNYADAGKHGDEEIVSNHYIPFSSDQIKIVGRLK